MELEFFRCDATNTTQKMQTDHDTLVNQDLVKTPGTVRVLVGVTGSVAAVKLPILVTELLQLSGVSCLVL